MKIVAAKSEHLPRWGEMRHALWDFESSADHADQAARDYLSGNKDRIAFIAVGDAGEPVGFAEATLRRDYVEGCETSPVAFLEGWYVNAGWRGQGIGRALLSAVRQWAQAQGCSELASDAALDNLAAQRAHAACGFAETERVVYFRMALDDEA